MPMTMEQLRRRDAARRAAQRDADRAFVRAPKGGGARPYLEPPQIPPHKRRRCDERKNSDD